MSHTNLLFLLTDQQRADTMACYGNDDIQTPNLNALAADSAVIDRCYVSQPVCSPSRATITAGLWPHSARVPACNRPLPADVSTFAEMIDPAYRRAWFGKWHLGDEIFPQHGFTEWVGTEDTYRPFYSSPERHAVLSDYHHFLVEKGHTPTRDLLGQKVFARAYEADLDEPLTKASYLADRAVDFLENAGDEPFALCVSYLEPHPPHTGPFNDLYDPARLPVGPTFRRKPPADAALLNRVQAAYYMESEEYGYDLRTDEGWRAVRARYWGNVTLVDRSVGRILDALARSGHAEDTLVVFTSDHGEMAGDHGILGKCVMYEESVRVPLLIRGPGIDGRTIAGNFSHIDLVPTMLDLLGQNIPDHLQGASRASVVRDRSAFEGDDIVIEWNEADGHPRPGEAEVNPAMAAPWRTIISPDGWKLNLSPVDRCELYDLGSDPHETTNLFNDPAHRSRIADLSSRLRSWQQQTADTVRLPDV